MDKQERAERIRQGNQLMNAGKMVEASKIFMQVEYSSGLERIGDILMDQNQPLVALRYYRLAKAQNKIEDILERMRVAMQIMLGADPKAEISHISANSNSKEES